MDSYKHIILPICALCVFGGILTSVGTIIVLVIKGIRQSAKETRPTHHP